MVAVVLRRARAVPAPGGVHDPRRSTRGARRRREGRALGAVIDGSETLAERVVLCAGSYATPAILLRSGIGPADELRRHGIVPVLDELPVGEGLADHPCAASSTPSRRAPSGAFVDSSGAVLGCAGLSVADASVIPTIPRANTNLSTVAVAELLAERIAES